MNTSRSFLRFFCLLVGLWVCFFLSSCRNSPPPTIVVYCGAGLNKVATELAVEFEKKTHISVQYNFGGSNILLSQLQLLSSGDVFIPGEAYYLEIAKNKGLIKSSQVIAFHCPVIAVPVGNPKHITGLEDLGRSDVKIALGDPLAAAIGRTTQELLSKNGLTQAVKKQVVAYTATVNELMVYLTLGQVDAAIVWEDNVWTCAGKIATIPIPSTQNLNKTISAGILTFTKQEKQAAQFIAFLCSPQAEEILRRYGFKPNHHL